MCQGPRSEGVLFCRSGAHKNIGRRKKRVEHRNCILEIGDACHW